MSEFVNCQDVVNMVGILEVDCPKCGAKGGIELFQRDGRVAEDGICDQCGYVIPEGTMLDREKVGKE